MRYLKQSRGFTLIELLATLAILSLVTTIAVPTIGKIIDTAGENTNHASIAMIESAARNADAAGLEPDEPIRYYVDSLIEHGYLDIEPDHKLVEGRPFVELIDTDYRYFGKTTIHTDDRQNLIADSNNLDRWEIYQHHKDPTQTLTSYRTDDGYVRVTSTGGTRKLKAYHFMIGLNEYAGQPVTVSFDIVNHADTPLVLYGNSLTFRDIVIEPGFNGRVEIQGRVQTSSEQIHFMVSDPNHDVDASIRHLKISPGTEFTDWEPAYVDVQ